MLVGSASFAFALLSGGEVHASGMPVEPGRTRSKPYIGEAPEVRKDPKKVLFNRFYVLNPIEQHPLGPLRCIVSVYFELNLFPRLSVAALAALFSLYHCWQLRPVKPTPFNRHAKIAMRLSCCSCRCSDQGEWG